MSTAASHGQAAGLDAPPVEIRDLPVNGEWAAPDAWRQTTGTQGDALFEGCSRMAVQLIAPFSRALAALKVSTNLAALLGLPPRELDNPELRIEHGLVERVLREAIAHGGRDLGLLAAEHAQPADLDAVEYLARAQPTLRAALERCCRYFGLLHDGCQLELTQHSHGWLVGLRFSDDTHDATYEFALAVLLHAARRITGNPQLAPLATHFAHARPASTSAHQRTFRSPLFFDQSQTALLLPSEALDLGLPAADPGLAMLLERHAENKLHKRSRPSDLLARIGDIVRLQLREGSLNAVGVAGRLGMSSRTMHRKLAQHGATYRTLIDAVRRDLALRSLLDPGMSIRELSDKLGFATSPAFHRAFRRWTGKTITTFRSELRTKTTRLPQPSDRPRYPGVERP